MVLVHLAHDFVVVVHFVKFKSPLVLLGLLSDGCKQFALLSELISLLPS